MNDKVLSISTLLQEARNPEAITPELLKKLTEEITGATLDEIAFGTLHYVRSLVIVAGQVATIQFTATRAELEAHGKKPH